MNTGSVNKKATTGRGLFTFSVVQIVAHNVFVLYILQYLTFALHFVGQGPVSMYNNFIYAIGFFQHFNGFD